MARSLVADFSSIIVRRRYAYLDKRLELTKRSLSRGTPVPDEGLSAAAAPTRLADAVR